jgi:hypothetical protein
MTVLLTSPSSVSSEDEAAGEEGVRCSFGARAAAALLSASPSATANNNNSRLLLLPILDTNAWAFSQRVSAVAVVSATSSRPCGGDNSQRPSSSSSLSVSEEDAVIAALGGIVLRPEGGGCAGQHDAAVEDDDDDDTPCLLCYTTAAAGDDDSTPIVVTRRHFINHLPTAKSSSVVQLLSSPMLAKATLDHLFSCLKQGGRLAVYLDLSRTFQVARAIGPTTVSLTPCLWSCFYHEYCVALKAADHVLASASTAAGGKDHPCALVPMLLAAHEEFFCDHCGSQLGGGGGGGFAEDGELLQGDITYGCRKCDFDLCKRCHAGKLKSAKDRVDAAFRAKLGWRIQRSSQQLMMLPMPPQRGEAMLPPMPQVQRWLSQLFTQCVVTPTN